MNKIKYVLFASVLTFVFTGCDYDDSYNYYYDDSLNVGNSGSYSISKENQSKNAYLVCYNDSDETKNSSKDYFYINSVSSNARVAINTNEKIETLDNNFNNELLSSYPKRINFIQPKFDYELISENNRSIANSTKSQKSYSGPSASFYLNENSSPTLVKATLKTTGTYCKIWYYQSSTITTDPDDSIFGELASWFDKIYTIETTLLCSNVPEYQYSNIIKVTSSTKINILVYDIGSDYTDTQTSGTYGFFNSIDFFYSDYEDTTATSNECEMFYVDTGFLTTKDSEENIVISPAMISTLVHEFQHMLGFVQKSLNYGNSSYGETWYTEMLSMQVEEFFAEYLGIDKTNSPLGRLPYYLSGSINGFSNWQSNSDDVYYNYANAYAFGAFLTRNFGGIELIRKIFNNNSLNEESIINALRSNGYGNSFSSLLNLFSQVQIYIGDDGSHVTLNKSGSTTIAGTKLSYSAIDLSNYISLSFDSEEKFNTALKKIMKISGVNSTTTEKYNDTTYYIYLGPLYYVGKISGDEEYTSSYTIYLGNISNFRINNTSGLKYRLIFK